MPSPNIVNNLEMQFINARIEDRYPAAVSQQGPGQISAQLAVAGGVYHVCEAAPILESPG